MASSRRSPCGCILATRRCSGGWWSGSREPSCMGPTPTEAARTTSGWLEGGPLWKTYFPCSRIILIPGSTPPPPSGSTRCGSVMPVTSPASGRGSRRRSMTDQQNSFPSVDALGSRFGLSHRQVEQLRSFGAALAWDEHAPTTVHDPARVRDDHLADSLVALDLPVVRAATAIADLGAGAGVPGLPLAIALPDARVVLVEGNGRKCAFMRNVAGGLDLSNVEVVHGRAETWRDG